VPDRELATEAAELLLGKDLRHETHLAERGDVPTIGDGDPRRLLAAVLEREEPEVRDARDVAIG
jgi:hypothetical protein